jgi:CheY-like chemotaxis protein
MAKLVIMEDEPDILMLVEATLNYGGHQVRSAGRGKQGIDLIRQELPDLVLLDLQMPDMCGYDILNVLKSDSNLNRIPVLLFSANNRPEDIQKGKAMGADGFIGKPFDPKMLLQQIDHTLKTLNVGLELSS